MEGGKLKIRFVPDEVVGHKIKSYRIIRDHKNSPISDNDPVPMKRAKAKDFVTTENGACNHREAMEKQKENKTPKRTPRKPDIVPPKSSERVLRVRKRPMEIQRIMATEYSKDDSDASDESDDENPEENPEENLDDDSTDNEIQFKSPSQVKLGKKVWESTQMKKDKTLVKELSRLKEIAEEYFAVHHQKKIVTSDRTMSKLENPRMTQKDLKEHLAEASGCHEKERSRLFKKYVSLFPKWIFQLRHGFNILFHGLGSKRRLLDEFRKQMLPDLVHIVINGFFPSLTLKSILNMISEDVLKYSGPFKNVIDQCNFIRSEYNTDDADELFLVIHNIDGPMLRNSKTQNALSYLASSSKIHLIVSIDHINAPVVWDQNRLSRFNWLWYDVTTFDRYTEETSFENSLLVQQTGSLALSSLTHVLRSLTPNARGIFKLLVQYQLDHDADTYYNGMSFGDLYQKCREKFLVNSDLTLRAQLTEFRDHKLIKFKKGADGVETLSIPLNSSNLKQFMDESDL